MNRLQFYLVGFGALMVFDTATQVAFKLASIAAGPFHPGLDWALAVVHSPWIWGAVVGYLGSFVAWMTVLKHAPVGPAFAASHSAIVLVLGLSVLFFGEHLSLMQIVGAALIILGVVFLSLSEAAREKAGGHG
jgi:drug/metabolite transporter (DMT)-like permease